MKYKVGDKVRVHNIHWFEVNCKTNSDGIYVMPTSGRFFIEAMFKLCGKIVTIIDVGSDSYRIKEAGYFWDDDMFKELINYNVGDKVRVHTKAWFEKNCIKHDIPIDGYKLTNDTDTFMSEEMGRFCGQEVTIKHRTSTAYKIFEDNELWNWEGWMFENKEIDYNKSSDIMSKIANILNIEIGQVLYYKDNGCRYRLSETSIIEVYNKETEKWEDCCIPFSIFINAIKESKFEKQWVPKDNEKIYYVDFYNEDLYNYMFYNPENEHFKNLLDCNMLYKTKQEAVEAAKKYMNQMKGDYKNEVQSRR